MAILNTRLRQTRSPKVTSIDWNNFKGGLNTLLKETEVKGNELVQADNLTLIGRGVPTKRWGTKSYFLSSSAGTVRGLGGFYQSDGTNQLLSITDEGVLTQKSNASYTIITGASWASGYYANMAQLDDKMYIVNGQRAMVRYSNPTLTSFPTIATPTGLFATGISGVSGTNTLSYRVSSISDVGETLASTSYLLPDQPQNPEDGSVLISWTGVSAASGDLKGYSLYGRTAGSERYIGFVDSTSTNFLDNGSAIPLEFGFPPTADTTGGLIAKYIVRFEDRLIYAGIDGEPSKVVISGRWPEHEKTDVSYGGNFIYIEPDSGDNITGLGVFENRIIVFKERSIWQITLTSVPAGNFTVWEPSAKLITASHGCISNRSIVAVENDVFFLTRNGIYALGYEPNVFNVLRTNEISAKIRPFFDNLTIAQKMNSVAFYHKFKYGIAFPGKNKTMTYDRERQAWMGPWTRDANVFHVYYDSSDNDHLLYGSDSDAYVYEYNESFGDDNGSAITTQLRTRKEDFGEWAKFKTITYIDTQFRNVQGDINIDLRLQEADGDVVTAKSFSLNTVQGSAGWGSFIWANAQWGDSPEIGGATDVNEVYRHTTLNKSARTLQTIIKTSNRNDNYEFLSFKAEAIQMGRGFSPGSERV